MEPLVATEQVAQGGGKDIARMGKRVAKPRPHTLVEEDLVGVREAVKELDYKVEALDTKIDTVETALTTKIDTKIDNAVATLNTKIDTVETALTTKIDTVETALTTKIDNAVATLTTKIDTVGTVMNIKLEGVEKGIREMKSWVKWGVIVGVAFMTALLVIIGIVVSKLG